MATAERAPAQRSAKRGARPSLQLSASTLALLAGLSAAPALAQTPSAPPVFAAPDSKGVDLVTGQYTPVLSALSIGKPGAGGLSYGVMLLSQSMQWSNLDTAIISGVACGATPQVTVGFNSETFTLTSGTYLSNQGTGSTLSCNSSSYVFTYTDRNGNVFTFSPEGQTGFNDDGGYVLTSAAYANGEVDTYSYSTGLTTCNGVACKAARLQSVTNNLGYQIQLQHSIDTLTSSNWTTWETRTTVTAINNAVNYCSPSANSCGNLSVTWPSVTYATSGTTETITDNAMSPPRVTTLTFTSTGQLTSIELPSGATRSVTYSGNVVSGFSDAYGTWSYTYNGTDPAFSTVTDPNGNSQTIGGNTLGQVVSSANGLNNTTSYAYDLFGRLTSVVYPSGRSTQYTYDSETASTTRGNIVTTIDTPASGSGNISVSATFPSSCTHAVNCNKPSSTTDGNGNTTHYTYDNTYGMLTKVDPPAPQSGSNQPETRLTYTPTYAWYYKNNATTIAQASTPVDVLTSTSTCQTEAPTSCPGTADEIKTSIGYQAGNSSQPSNVLPVSATQGSGAGNLATASVGYDDIGNVTSSIGPLGTNQTTVYFYDADRENTGFISPNPGASEGLPYPATQITYNSDGLVTEVQTGTDTTQSDTGWTSFTSVIQLATTYDNADRAIRQAQSGGGTTYNVTQLTYDNANRLQCSAVRMNLGSLPSSACTPGTPGSSGPDRITGYSYDAANELTGLTVASGTSAQATYATAAYTPDGALASVLDAMNNLTSYAYDGYDRLIQTTFPLKTQGAGTSDSTDYETYAYDFNGNMTSIRKRSGDTVGFSFDALNRPTEKTVPSPGQDAFYSYDLVSRLTSATFGSPTGAGVSYTYDALSRALTETAGGLTLTSAYDAAGDRTQLTWPDGFSVGYAFDFLQRSITVTGSGVGTLASYVWDGIGDLTAIDRGNGANTTYAYDGDDRLSGITHAFANSAADVAWSFRYDAGNGLLGRGATNDAYTSHGAAQSQGYLGNGLNQYASVTTANYTYDGRGNLTSDGTRSFTYDVDNRLLTGSAPTAVTLAYDPTGRLQTSTASSATTTFLYDGANLAAEYNGGTVLRRYVPSGLGTDMPLIWYEGAAEATPRWLHADNQGSIVAYSDLSGDNDDIYGYDPWGLPDSANGWSGSRFRYTGQITIPQAGLYYYKARVYDPGLGRFLQTDPVGYASDVNAYAYVRNGPTNGADPSGMDGCPASDFVPNSTGDLDLVGDFIICGSSPSPSSGSGFGGNGGSGLAPGQFRQIGGTAVAGVTVTAARKTPQNKGCLANVGSFVNAHLPDAQTLANELGNGVTPAEVLGTAGNETHYGGGFASIGNYFGLHGHGPAGTYYTSSNHTAVMEFSGGDTFLASGQVFVNNVSSYMQPGMGSNPLAFFSILNQHGYATGNSGYPAFMVAGGGNRGPYTLVNACLGGH